MTELVLRTGLTDDQMRSSNSAATEVLWGWKRDRGMLSRTVFFEGRMRFDQRALTGVDMHLFFRSRLPPEQASFVSEPLLAAIDALRNHGFDAHVEMRSGQGMTVVQFQVGCASRRGADLIERLVRRRPRRALAHPCLPPSLPNHYAAEFFPADLYVGSGVSYEAGVPTLCDMHQRFGVDRPDGSDFAFGFDDELPTRLSQHPLDALASFFDVHVGAAIGTPTRAMNAIRSLCRDGHVGCVYTDNVDNLLGQAGVSVVRVRGSGVLNERFPVEPRASRLIVVGVAADRREVVRQYRRAGAKVIVVNPVAKVSPRVRHLDYLRPRDAFFRTTADEFFSSVTSEDAERRKPSASNA